MTQTRRILDFVAKNPGRTAWRTAKKLKLNPGTVSSTMLRLCRRGALERRRFPDAWVYYVPGIYVLRHEKDMLGDDE